jgi:beta-glucosidase
VTRTEDVLHTFDDAVKAVASGADPDAAAQRLVAGLTPDEKLWCLDGDTPCWAGLIFLTEGGYHRAVFGAGRIPRVGLPGLAFSDGPRGVVIGNRTCFPVSMARGATWDPDLEEEIGEAIGRELRQAGANLYGGVCVNLLRHPAWGRAQETYGEDPTHVGEMGAALSRGIQRHAMACVKHLACNSMENARFRVDVTVDEVALHEVYLAQFRRIVDEGVAAVMTAYNSVNGAYCAENRPLLRDVVRREWGFDGVIISDWIYGLRTATGSVDGGLDVEMPYRMVRARDLGPALDSGEVSWRQVDEAAAHLVATLLRFAPVIGGAGAPSGTGSADRDHEAAHRRLARQVASRSVVLMRNEPVDGRPVLPLDDAAALRLGVFGALADTVNLGDAGSSDVWALDCVTVLAGLRDAATTAAVTVVDETNADAAAAGPAAAEFDVAIVVVGTTYEDEGEFIGDTGVDLSGLFPSADDPELVERWQAEIADLSPITVPDHVARRPSEVTFASGGDRRSLRLSPADVELVRAVAGANRRTVVVLQGGSAILCSEWDTSVAAIVHTFYGGVDAGGGLADVLFGRAEPGGRLPFSVPADESHLPAFSAEADAVVYDRWHGWWHLERAGHRPAYPFGYGLGYTSFSVVDATARIEDGTVVVHGSVANTGDRDGSEVVQVYARLADGEAPRRLVGFARVAVSAGGERRFEVRVRPERLARRDPEAHRWVGPDGAVEIEVARHVGDPDPRRSTVVF